MPLALAVFAVAAVAACEPRPVDELPLVELVGELDPASRLIGCDRAGDAVTITASSHLDPACTYTQGIAVRASGTTLDCRGARIESLDRTAAAGWSSPPPPARRSTTSFLMARGVFVEE